MSTYRFSGFTLDLARGSLHAPDGAEVSLRPKSFARLRCLIENAGRLLDRDALMRAVWPGVFVTDDSLIQGVKKVRRAGRIAGGMRPSLPPRLGGRGDNR